MGVHDVFTNVLKTTLEHKFKKLIDNAECLKTDFMLAKTDVTTDG